MLAVESVGLRDTSRIGMVVGVDGIDLTPELIETARVLTKRCKLADRVKLRLGNALDLPYSDQTFDVVWSPRSISWNLRM
jgi:ubiquinone/menaquinone biosynthesis C-methylase UbiE